MGVINHRSVAIAVGEGAVVRQDIKIEHVKVIRQCTCLCLCIFAASKGNGQRQEALDAYRFYQDTESVLLMVISNYYYI